MKIKENDPVGKCMKTVKVGPKFQIVIPKEVRELLEIEIGDNLLMLADKERGIAIVDNDVYMKFANSVFKAQKED